MSKRILLILTALLSVSLLSGCWFSESTEGTAQKVSSEIQANVNKPQETWLYPAFIYKDDSKIWGYINKEGKFIIEPAYVTAGNFYKNGVAIVNKNGKYGLLDKKGKYVLDPVYKYITYLEEGLFSASDENGSKLIDANGKVLFETNGSIGKFSDGLSEVYQKVNSKDRQCGYINTEGKVVIDFQYSSGFEFNNGKALVKTKDGKNTIINKNGEALATLNYDNVHGLSDGTIIYYSNNRNGYLSDDGSILTEAKFQSAQSFSGGFAIVNNSGKSYGNYNGVINKKGEFVIEPKYAGVWQVDDGLFAVSEKGFSSVQAHSGPKFIINSEGKQLSHQEYYDIDKFNGDYASASDENSTFFIDKKGDIVSGLPKVEGIGTMEIVGDMVKAQIDHELIYLTRDGKRVWQSDNTYTLQEGITVKRLKYRPNRVTLAYYPEITGLRDKQVQDKINSDLKDKFTDSNSKIEKHDGMYEANIEEDFSISLNKDLFTVMYSSYYFPFGAAHGQPSELYYHVDRNSGKFYTLSDLFRKNSDYTKRLSDIVGKQIEKKKKDDGFFTFEGSYKGIRPDHNFTVNKDALQVYFFPYEIASYAQGFITFDIPYGEIEDIIDTEGAFWKSFDKVVKKEPNAQFGTAPDSSDARIKRAMDNYEKNMVEAINKNDFNIVKPYLVKNSKLYKAQLDLVPNLNQQGIKERLVEFKVKDVKQQGASQVKVYVDESVAIQYPGKEYATKQFSYIYTLVETEGGTEYRLSDIEKWDK